MSRLLPTALALLLGIFAIAALPAAALADKRVALVIGNSAYKFAPKLTNPRNDATDVAEALKKYGFQVIDGFDLDKAAFDRKVRDFAAALKGADAGVLFYAGHGLQVAGQNYLVPIDAKAEEADALDFEMLRVDVIHRIMERQTNTNILFLDACRDNPLARNLARSLGTRSAEIGSGLARVESGVGTLISFSTQPGNVALDGAGRNSPFAGALVKQLSTSNDDLSAILIAVRNDVMQQTQRKQVPWENSALTGRFYFNPAAQTAEPAKVAPARLSEAAEAWGVTKETTSVAVLEAYIARYKDTFYAELARARIEELKKEQKVATAKSEPAKNPDKPSRPDVIGQTLELILPSQGKDGTKADDRQKQAMLQKQEDDRKRADANAARKHDGAAGGSTMRSGTVFRDCPDCPEMVVVPAGEFLMGSPDNEEGREKDEGPQHHVTIAKAFAVGKFEVTFAEWDACVTARGCKHNPGDENWGRGRHPVINVSWDDITQDYLPWLARKSGAPYRLLSEAEWEYAARAGTTTRFAFGDSISKTRARYSEGKALSAGKTVAIGSFQANAFGLHDMHGNVWEWTQDCWHENYQSAPNSTSAWNTGDCRKRVVRGGSWGRTSEEIRSATRYGIDRDVRDNGVGFRVARTLTP